MIIPGDLIKKIKPFLERKEFVSVIGPGQSGFVKKKRTKILFIPVYYLQEFCYD